MRRTCDTAWTSALGMGVWATMKSFSACPERPRTAAGTKRTIRQAGGSRWRTRSGGAATSGQKRLGRKPLFAPLRRCPPSTRKPPPKKAYVPIPEVPPRAESPMSSAGARPRPCAWSRAASRARWVCVPEPSPLWRGISSTSRPSRIEPTPRRSAQRASSCERGIETCPSRPRTRPWSERRNSISSAGFDRVMPMPPSRRPDSPFMSISVTWSREGVRIRKVASPSEPEDAGIAL